MPKRLASRKVLPLLAAVVLPCCGDAAQQQPPIVRVKVTILGITAEVDALKASVSLEDKPLDKSPQTYNNNHNVLWIELAPKTTGRLSVSIDALRGGCKIETAKNDIQLAGDSYYELSLPLNVLPNTICTLTIEKTGAGYISTNLPGIDCGNVCSAEYQLGTSVTITARPDIPTFPPTWSSLCKGKTSTCVLAINGPTTVTVNFLPKVCTETGWCWENPIPQGNSLLSAWVAPDQTAFAVGESGTAIQWNGYGWLALPTGLSRRLYGVWGLSSTDAWAIGEQGTALHWKGSGWTATPSNTTSTLMDLWGANSTDVWAVGDLSTIIHWDGSNWTPTAYSTTDIKGIWGSGSNDVWAVTASSIPNGSVLRWNGSKWSDVTPLSVFDNYYSVWGSGPSDVLVSGVKTIYRWNGTTWNTLNVPMVKNFVSSLWGTGVNNIYAVADGNSILRWQGASWSNVYTSPSGNISRLIGSGPNDIWAVGDNGLSIHWDGSSWTQNGNDVSMQPTPVQLQSGCGTGPDDAWIVGSQGSVFHWNGTALQRSANVPTSNDLYAVWCAPPSLPGTPTDSVWAVGANGTIILWNGFAWSSVQGADNTTSLRAVIGNTATDVWISGSGGTVLRWDGTKLNRIATTSTAFYDLSALQGNRLYVAQSSSATIDTYDGASWSTLPNAAPCAITAMAVAGNSFFVGGSVNGKISPGCVRHYNGTIWLDDYNPTNQVRRLASRGNNDLWVETLDSLTAWNGMIWKPIDIRTNTRLASIFTSGANDIFLIGATGAVLHSRQ